MPGAFSSKRHFLFDLDGTLVDSQWAHEHAFVATLRPSHADLARNFDYALYAGRTTQEVFIALGIMEEPMLSEMTHRKQQLYREAVERGEVVMFAGVKALLELLQKRGCGLYLVTGASRTSARRVLESTNLGSYFTAVTVAEDVVVGKPSPEPYLHTLAVHGLRSEDCLVIEDGESGIRSALSAGLEAVLIHTDLELPGVLNVHDCSQFMSLLLE